MCLHWNVDQSLHNGWTSNLSSWSLSLWTFKPACWIRFLSTSMIIRMGPVSMYGKQTIPVTKNIPGLFKSSGFFPALFSVFCGEGDLHLFFSWCWHIQRNVNRTRLENVKMRNSSNFDVSCHFIVISYFYRECRLPGWYPPSNWAPGPLQWTEEGLPRPNLKTQCRENASQLAALSLVLLNIRNYSETLPNACDLVTQSTQCLKFETCICRRISQNPKYIFLVSERQCLSPDEDQLFLLLCVFWSQICSLVLPT